MDSKKRLVSQIIELIQWGAVILFIVGLVGGSIAASYTKGSFFQNIAALSCLPILNMWLWQWVGDARMESWKRVLMRLLVATLSVGFLVLTFLIPDAAILVALSVVSICLFFFFFFLVVWPFMANYIN